MPQTKLGDVIELKRGYDLAEDKRVEGSIPIISSSGTTGYHNEAKVSGPGVVTGRYGTLGEVFYVEGEFWPLNTALYVRDFKGNSPRFIAYFLKYLLGNVVSDKAAVPGLNRNALHARDVFVPDPDEQRRIAAVLSTYDDLIENNRKRIKLLERAARLLYTEWFVRGRFPGHQVVKKKDGVPEGWEKTVFGKLVEQVKVSVKPEEVEADTPYIGLEHIPRRALVLNEWGKAEQVTSNKFAFQEDDILFGKIRPYFHKVGFAITNGITSSDAIVMRVSEPDLYALALSVVSSDRFIAVASKSAKEGSKMPRADWKQMQAYPLLLPDTRTLSKFNEALHPMLSMMKVLAKQNIQLIRARDLLLPRLMSGKVKA